MPSSAARVLRSCCAPESREASCLPLAACGEPMAGLLRSGFRCRRTQRERDAAIERADRCGHMLIAVEFDELRRHTTLHQLPHQCARLSDLVIAIPARE